MIIQDTIGGKAEKWFSEVRKGYARLVILSLLSQKPMHGYKVMKTIKDIFIGWSPSASAIYPILHDLEEDGYVASTIRVKGGKTVKIYQVTERGETQFKRMIARQVEFNRRLKSLFKGYAVDILGLPHSDVDSLDLDFLEANLERITAFDALSRREKIDILRKRKERLGEAFQHLKNIIDKIDTRLAELERYES